MPLGARSLSVHASVRHLAELVADFEGVRLRQVRAMVKGLQIDALSFAPGCDSSVT
jgi:hypothetical protein